MNNCYIANMRGSLSSDIQSQRSGFEAQGAAIKVFEMNLQMTECQLF